jgi:hypothetical protein
LLLGATASGQELQTNHVVEKVVTRDIPFFPERIPEVRRRKSYRTRDGLGGGLRAGAAGILGKKPDKAVAARELQYMKYALSREANTLEIRNTFIIPPEITRTQSSLEALYELTVPRKSKVEVTDKYGNVQLTAWRGKLDVTVEFGDIQLQNVAGRTSVESSYGEVRGSDIGGTFSCKSDKSDIYLDRIEARCTFNSTYGNIHLAGEKPKDCR